MARARASRWLSSLDPRAVLAVAAVCVAVLGAALIGFACGGSTTGNEVAANTADGGTDGGVLPDGGTDGGVVPDGGAHACVAPPTNPSLDCPAESPLDCGDGVCCGAGHPFECSSTESCYATQAEALAACGSTCRGCVAAGATDGGTDGGTQACLPPPAQPFGCSGQSPMDCGEVCCPADHPFNCASTRSCYATEADALAACGSACQTCARVGSTECIAAPPPSQRTCGGGYLTCATGCCASDAPYGCVELAGSPPIVACHATVEEAAAACGASCMTCAP